MYTMNKKIRVMQITHDLAIGGLQQVVVNLCNSIDKEKFDVSVLCLRERGVFASDVEKIGINVLELPKSSGTDYFAFLKVAKILKRENIDVIHTHNTQPFIDGTLAAVIAGVRNIIHTDHARSFPDKKRYMFAEWLVSHFAYKVVGVSEHTSSNLIKYEKISPKKITTIPNGIDASRYNLVIDKSQKKNEIGITNQGPVLGIGVRLEKQKGITYLLNAMPSIIREFPDITLVIAGKGSLEEDLRNEADQLNLNNNIIFTGPRLDIAELLRIFDLYVLPSLWEGLPMVLIEAMAAKCPIVATNVGGNYMAINHGINGSLVEPADSEVFATEIIKILKDDDLRTSYINEAYKKYEAEFSSRIMTDLYQKLYIESFSRK